VDLPVNFNTDEILKFVIISEISTIHLESQYHRCD